MSSGDGKYNNLRRRENVCMSYTFYVHVQNGEHFVCDEYNSKLRLTTYTNMCFYFTHDVQKAFNI